MFSIALHEPEIPPNTGNIIRLCANTGCQLHLIEPLGFSLDEKQMRRAGLDYHQYAKVDCWPDWQRFIDQNSNQRLVCFSTHNEKPYSDFSYQAGDILLFGAETRGLPRQIMDQIDPEMRLLIPMQPSSRSLNLSNCVSIVVYEAWRQHGFAISG